MKSYQEIKLELEKERKAPHFTKKFYEIFCSEWQLTIDNCIKKTETDNNFVETKKSDFYNLDSVKYCEFLEIFYYSIPKYRIDRFKDVYGWEHVSRTFVHCNDETTARKIAAAMATNDIRFYEVMLVA